MPQRAFAKLLYLSVSMTVILHANSELAKRFVRFIPIPEVYREQICFVGCLAVCFSLILRIVCGFVNGRGMRPSLHSIALM